MDMVGDDQVLMGSDFPTIDRLGDAVAIVKAVRANAAAKRKLLGGKRGQAVHGDGRREIGQGRAP